MKKRIMIVDDSATARMHVVRELSEEFECVTAQNGEEALRLLPQTRPDAIVSDLEMGFMGGTELLRSLKAHHSTELIPVIIVTTVTKVEDMNTCRSLGCAGFVLKPVDGSYLRAKLKRLFANEGLATAVGGV